MDKTLDIFRQVLELPENKRAALASHLLESLPASLVDEDEGIEEARRRSKELDENPGMAVSWDEIKTSLGR